MIWEYMIIRDESEAALQVKLDEHGKQGWEAFATSQKILSGGTEITRVWLKRGTVTRAERLLAKLP